MIFKSKFVIKNLNQMLLINYMRNFNMVVKDTRMDYFSFFLEKITSCAGFLGFGLKRIFHWSAHRDITPRSRFKYLADSLRSWTAEKNDVSSANNLAMELSPSDRSLIYIKNNRCSRMDSCRIPAFITSQLDSWPFNNTL